MTRAAGRRPPVRRYHLAVLPGDGIGPEVTAQALAVLQALQRHQLLRDDAGNPVQVTLAIHPVGGAAIDLTGMPLPPATWEACRGADAVLLGAVGGPTWEDLPPEQRPERGLLELRRRLGVFANLRPVRQWLPPARGQAPIDLLIVRELTGGIYFGQPRGMETLAGGERRAYDTMAYTEREITRVARVGFQQARQRRQRLVSVDKANVLATSRLWRQVVQDVAAEFPEVLLEHQLVDSFALRLVRDPGTVDVVLTGNLFGDILSDLAGGLVGTLGLLPSASLGNGSGPGLFEPVHGSAPTIAGRNQANPVGMILSLALLCRYGLGLTKVATLIESAVAAVLAAGWRTADLAAPGEPTVGTQEMGAHIVAALLGAGSQTPRANK